MALISLIPASKKLDLPSIVSGSEMVKNPAISKPAELVIGLLHRGTKCILASVSKAGKTWLLILLALCVATGTKFLRWVTVKCPVLYVNLEIHPAFMKERLTALMEVLGLSDCGQLDVWNLRGKVTNFDALTSRIIKEAAGKGYGLIILDPVYKMFNGKSENTAGSVANFANQIERLAAETGAAVVCSHHFAKGNLKKKSAMDRMSGSGVFARDADTIITLTPHAEPDCYTVEMTLRNLPEQESFVAQWQYPIMLERPDLEAEGDQNPTDTRARQLLKMLVENPLTTGEWEAVALQQGISRASFFRTKADLNDGGHISYNSVDKSWSITPGLVEIIDTPETAETAETVDTRGTSDTAGSGEPGDAPAALTVCDENIGADTAVVGTNNQNQK